MWYSCPLSPWYDLRSWLGVKSQLSIYPVLYHQCQCFHVTLFFMLLSFFMTFAYCCWVGPVVQRCVHCLKHLAWLDHLAAVCVPSYELTYTAVWWQDMLQGKEKSKNFLCLSTQEEKKSFNFQVGPTVLICSRWSALIYQKGNYINRIKMTFHVS